MTTTVRARWNYDNWIWNTRRKYKLSKPLFFIILLSQLYKHWQQVTWMTDWTISTKVDNGVVISGPFLVYLSLHWLTVVIALLATVYLAALRDGLGFKGIANFRLRDLGGALVFHGLSYICLLHIHGQKGLWGRSGLFYLIRKRVHLLFSWGC